jgi:predicted site-specific integrase-resolvase
MVHMGHNKRVYSISDAVRELGIDRKTLRRWAKDKLIPAPSAAIVNGRLIKCWNEKGMEAIRKFKTNFYGGKGMDRRKGSRAKQARTT